MAKKFAKLNHYCNAPGLEGQPDDVIETDDKGLAYLLERRGAVEVNAKGEAPGEKTGDKPAG